MKLNSAQIVYKKFTTNGTLAVLGVGLIYAVCFTAIKFGLAYAPPLVFGGLRAFTGGLALLAVLLVIRQPLFPGRTEWGAIALVGLISTTLNFGAMFLSPSRTSAGIASVLGNIQPLVTLVLAAIFLGEPLSIWKTTALILGLVGVTLIAYPAFSGLSGYGIDGGVLALSVSASSAIGSILVKHLIQKANLLAVAAWQLLIGSLPLLAASAVIESAKPIAWGAAFIGVLLFLSLVGTSFVTVIWYVLLRKYEVSRITLFLFLTPLFGLGIAALIFKEQVGFIESVGVASTLAGLCLAGRKTG